MGAVVALEDRNEDRNEDGGTQEEVAWGCGMGQGLADEVEGATRRCMAKQTCLHLIHARPNAMPSVSADSAAPLSNHDSQGVSSRRSEVRTSPSFPFDFPDGNAFSIGKP